MTVDADSLANEMERSIGAIGQFVKRREFKQLLAELRAVPPSGRAEFVEEVLLDANELARRGICVPDGMVIQRSYFADNRPTLFCVTKRLPDPNSKWKVTITFDSDGQLASFPLAVPPADEPVGSPP